MGYIKPLYEEIFATTKNDLFARFPTLDPTLRESMAEAIVGVIAAGLNGNYNFIQYVSEQVFPDTASIESLDQWGSVVGLSRFPAEKGAGFCEFTGVSGSTVPTGAELSTESGNLFEVETGFTLSSTSTSANVIAQDFGTDGNLQTDDELTFTTTYAGMDSIATAAEDFTGGRDRETDDEYRIRVIEKFQSPAKGGSEDNYVAWVKEAVQATRVWIRSWEDSYLYGETIEPGYVSAYFAIDDVYQSGIPLPIDQIAVDDYVNELKPIGTFFNSKLPLAGPVDVDVKISPYSVEISGSVAGALDQAILEHGVPGGTIRVSDFNNALASVTAVDSYNITSPTSNVTLSAGVLHTPGAYNITAL